MGYNSALDLAENLDISLEQAIGMHLQGNHYPPVPLTMVQPCIDAIDAIHAGDGNTEIVLPEGVLYKNQPTAPAYAIAEQHHLHAWLPEEDY